MKKIMMMIMIMVMMVVVVEEEEQVEVLGAVKHLQQSRNTAAAECWVP